MTNYQDNGNSTGARPQYPTEQPVNLRQARKATPPPPQPKPEAAAETFVDDYDYDEDALAAYIVGDDSDELHTDTADYANFDTAEAAWSEPDSEQPTYAAAQQPVEETYDETAAYVPTSAERAAQRPTIETLRSELLPAPPGVDTDPAQWGFKGWANTASGGGLKLKPTPPEVEYRRACAAVAQQWHGRQMIMVANPKGGEGKTPTSLMLGNTFASLRGGSVVGWDNNETEGTLAYRAAAATPDVSVYDLLARAGDLASPHAEASALSRFLRMQPTKLEVLAADESARRMEQISADHCRSIYGVLRRFRDLVIVDTGNNRRKSNWLWTAHNADLLVIPMTYREASAAVVCRMLEALESRGLHSLVANAIVVLSVPPTEIGEDERKRIDGALEQSGIRNTIAVPYDPILAGGGRLDYTRLSKETVRAWTRVCAMAATSLATSSAQRPMELTVSEQPTSFAMPPEYDSRTGGFASYPDTGQRPSVWDSSAPESGGNYGGPRRVPGPQERVLELEEQLRIARRNAGGDNTRGAI